MAFISYVDDRDASPELCELMRRYGGPAGRVDNILRIHGHNPPSLEAHYRLYTTLMHGSSTLSKVQREMIAVVVSSINGCLY